MRKYMIFHKEWYEAIALLPEEQQMDAMETILEYGLNGTIPEREGAAMSILALIKDTIDRECKVIDNHGIRTSPEYNEWRRKVFERDDYTCQICGQRGGKLNAHHIKRFADFPEKRCELSNGITLCERCHKNIHRKGQPE